jgi:hypothetical protein
MAYKQNNIVRALLLPLVWYWPAAQGAEYIRAEQSAPVKVQPVKGGMDHAFAPAPKRPVGFLGPLHEHLSANIRSYDYRQDKENGDENAASVIGGSLRYHTGHWRDRLGFGATVYTSQKIWGPDSKAGSGLLKPTQESFTVLGEAYAELKFDSVEVLAFRREMDLPYINKEDIRQVPITHESYVLGRRGTGRDFVLGHVSQIKKRDDDSFISMSEAAGVDDKNKGVSVAGFQLQLPRQLRFGAMTQQGWDTFNTTYTDLMWDHKRASGWSNHLGAQFTDQRSVGDELLGNYDAQAWGVRGGLGYDGQSVKIAYTDYSDGGTIARPYGGTPNFNALMIEKADKAGEQAVGVHLGSHFSKFGLPNWSANFSLVSGWNIVDPGTGESQADETEYDFTLDYRPKQGVFKGLWLRMRYVYIDFDSGVGHRWNTRVIINYQIPGLAGS